MLVLPDIDDIDAPPIIFVSDAGWTDDTGDGVCEGCPGLGVTDDVAKPADPAGTLGNVDTVRDDPVVVEDGTAKFAVLKSFILGC